MSKKIFSLLVLACFFSTIHAQLNAEQKLIKQTFFNFLKFYQKNETKFNSFKLYKGTGDEDAPPYKIQWKEAERYFTYLRTSVPFVGEAYIKAERNHFKFSDSCFKADPEEEIAAGFDYDRWAGGQESIEYTVKWYTSPKNKYEVNIKGNKAELRIGGELWEGAEESDRSWSIVPFVKEKGVWKMADNIYPMEIDESNKN
jgi:hypothetical protein